MGRLIVFLASVYLCGMLFSEANYSVEDQVIENFATIKGWAVRMGEAKIKESLNSPTKDSRSIRIEYFVSSENPKVLVDKRVWLKDWSQYSVITFWVNGDGSGNKIAIQVKDADENSILQTPPIVMDFKGWRFFAVPFTEFINAWNGSVFDWDTVGSVRIKIWLGRNKGGKGIIFVSRLALRKTINVTLSPQDIKKFIDTGGKPKILFLGLTHDYFTIIHEKYKKKLEEDGYIVKAVSTLEFLKYPEKYLEDCNVVVITHFYSHTKEQTKKPFFNPTINKILYDFVKQGGGLFIIPTFVGYGGPIMVEQVNNFLSPLGLKILYERVQDKEHSKTRSYIIDYEYSFTNNFSRHPITEDLKLIWYPTSDFPRLGLGTYTFSVADASSSWKVILKGMESAFSKTYTSAPPLLAVKQYGEGRIAVFTSNAIYWVSDGYHPGFGGFVLEEGDGYRLLCKVYDWLGRPSMEKGRIFLPPPTPEKIFSQDEEQRYFPIGEREEDEKILKAMISNREEFKIYKGFIGIHSTFSDGEDTPEDFVRVAKNKGYDFIVFTENYDSMTPEKWQQLTEVCRRLSDDKFLAIPGLVLTTERGVRGNFSGTRILFNLARFPSQEQAFSWSKTLLHNGWPSVVLYHPNLNKMSPGVNRFYTGFSVFSYENNKLIDDAAEVYKKLTASDYRLIPMAVNMVYSVKDLREFEGFLTYVRAKNIKDVPARLRTIYGSGNTFVSNGPQIRRFLFAFDSIVRTSGDKGASAKTGESILFYVDVFSDVPLKEVILYRNNEILRRFKPQKEEFSDYIHVVNSEDALYILEVKDQNGRRAFSNSINIYNRTFNYSLSVDKQNNFITLYPTKNEKKAIIASWIKGHWAGVVSLIMPDWQASPRVLDVQKPAINVFDHLWFYTKEGIVRSPYVTRERILSTADAILIKNNFEGILYPWSLGDKAITSSILYPDCKRGYMKGTVTYTIFRPKLYGYNLIFIDIKAKILKDMILTNSKGLEIELVRLATSKAIAPYKSYTYISPDGRKHSGGIDFPRQYQYDKVQYIPAFPPAKISARGYVGLWPHAAGNFAVFPLDGKEYDICLGMTSDPTHALVTGERTFKNYLTVGIEAPERKISAGTILHSEFLFSLDNGRYKDDRSFDFIKNSFLKEDRNILSLTHGEFVEKKGRLILSAKDGYISGKIKTASLPNNLLPIVVRGINKNWDAAVYYPKKKLLRRIGVSKNNVAYVVVDTSEDREIFIGNLLTSNIPQVKLTLWKDKIIVHNPTDKSLKVEVKSPLYKSVNIECTLLPGESKSFPFNSPRKENNKK